MNIKKTAVIFLIIVSVALALHLIIFPTTMVGGDEGRYTLDALRIGGGEIPIADYTTRTPILLYLMFVSVKLFGLNLFALRLPMMLFSALTAGVLFLLGKELYSKRVGIISATVYMLAPMVLWSNQLIKSENLAVLLVALASLLLVKGIQKDRWYWFILSGLSVGVAYIERQSAVSFLVLAGFVLLWVAWQNKGGFKRFIQYSFSRGSLVALGFLAGFLPIFLYFFLLNSSTSTELWFSLFIVNSALAPQETVFNLYQFIRGWVLTFVEAIATQGWVIYFGAVSFVALVVSRVSDKKLWKYISAIVFLLLSVPFYIHAGKAIVDWDFAPLTFVLATIGGTLFWFVVAKLYLLNDTSEPTIKYNLSSVLIVSWVVSVFVVYLIYNSGYSREFLVPLSLASGVIMSGFFSMKQSVYKGVVVLSLIILWMGGFIWFSDPRTGGWWWDQRTVIDASEFIRAHTQEGEEIFTASALPVLFAGRDVYKQLNPYAIMLAPDDDTGWGTQPSPNEILQGLKSNSPRYVLYDGRMGRNFIRKTNNEELEAFLKSNYTPVASFGSGHRQDWIEIWEGI